MINALVNQVLYQLTSAAQRFLELQLENATDIHVIVPTSAAVLVSHTAQWTTVLEKLDAVYPAVLECYKNDSQGSFEYERSTSDR
jgi:hypothetical protein